MVYIRRLKVKGRIYYALSHAYREGDKIHKFSRYLGKSLPPKEKLEKLKLKFLKELAALKEPQLLAPSQKQAIEKIKQNYRKHIQKLTKSDIEKLDENISENFTYNTNAIEGSKLTLADVRSVFEGATPSGKPLQDIYGAKNMREAYAYIKKMKNLSQKEILDLHKIAMRDILAVEFGKYRSVQVYIGAHVPPPPDRVPQLMKELFAWYKIAGKKLHPFELACKLHAKFENIHPFRDGNGRVGRLIMNYILLKKGYPLLDIKFENRPEYYEALALFESGRENAKPLIDYAFKVYVANAKKRGWF